MRLILELQTCTSVRPTAWASAGAERPSDAAFNDGASVPIVLIWERSSRLEALLGRTAIIGAVAHGEYAPAHPTADHPNQNTPTTTSRQLQHSLQAVHASPIRRVHRRPIPRQRAYQLVGTAEYT